MPIYNGEKIKQRISETLGILDLTDSQQNKIISGLMDNISDRIDIAVYDKLAEEDRKKFQKISKMEDKEVILFFLKSKIRNLPLLVDEIVRETIDEFENLKKV